MTTEDKPILLQGAMDIEIAYFLAKLKNKEKTVVNNFVFWQGDLPEGKVVISKTRIGTAMAAGATALGIHLYEPRPNHQSGNLWRLQPTPWLQRHGSRREVF